MKPLLASLLTTGELTTAAERLHPVFVLALAGQPLLLQILAAAEQHRSALVLSATRKDGSDFTDPLRLADAARDAAFISLRNFATTWSTTPTASAGMSAAAARLVQIFTHHGNTLYTLGYAQETAKINELITDLRSPAATADLTTLSLTALFAELVSKQQEFEILMADKIATESGQNLPTINQHRPQLERYLNLLLAAIEAAAEIQPSAALSKWIDEINDIITVITTPALARRTRQEHEVTPPSAPPTA